MHLGVGFGPDTLAEVILHELFHIFQDAYDGYGGQFPDESFYWGTIEGGADLAVDFVLDNINQYVVNGQWGSLRNPGTTLATPITWRFGSSSNWPYAFAFF